MRLYTKLALLVAAFLGLARMNGEAGRACAWEVSFAARCHVAELLGDERLRDHLVAEARIQLQRRRQAEVMPVIATAGASATPEPAAGAAAQDALALGDRWAESSALR
jgi:hypothetical protein